MPYKRYNKRKYYRRRRYHRRITYPMIGKKIWRDVKYLKSIINVEKKYVDYTFTNTISTTENFQLLNGMTQGDTALTREGQSIRMKSLFIRMYSVINASATSTQLRLIIFIDKQPNAATATSGSLLSDNTNILSPLLIGYGNRFVVLLDKIYRMDSNKNNIVFKYFKKLNFHVKYNTGNVGTVADINTNALYYMLVSDQATNTPQVDIWARIRFIDN